jgi:hypothetical protein
MLVIPVVDTKRIIGKNGGPRRRSDPKNVDTSGLKFISM